MKRFFHTRLTAVVYAVLTVLLQAAAIIGGIYAMMDMEAGYVLLILLMMGGVCTFPVIAKHAVEKTPQNFRGVAVCLLVITVPLGILLSGCVYPIFYIMNLWGLFNGAYPAAGGRKISILWVLLPALLVLAAVSFQMEAPASPGETPEIAIANRYPDSRMLEVYPVSEGTKTIAAEKDGGALFCARVVQKSDGLWFVEEEYRVRTVDRRRNNADMVMIFSGDAEDAVVIVRKFQFANAEDQLGAPPVDSRGSEFGETVRSSSVGDFHYYYAWIDVMDDAYWIKGWSE